MSRAFGESKTRRRKSELGRIALWEMGQSIAHCWRGERRNRRWLKAFTSFEKRKLGSEGLLNFERPLGATRDTIKIVQWEVRQAAFPVLGLNTSCDT
jgi:hypothetical protein